MALIKNKEWKYGVTVSYWIIYKSEWDKTNRHQIDVTITPTGATTTITNVAGYKLTVVGYTNEASRQSDIKSYIPESIYTSIDGTDLNLSQQYTLLKQTYTWFSDAIDG